MGVDVCCPTATLCLQAATTDGSTLSHELTGLVEGADYFIRVRAENMAGVSTGYSELDEPACAKEPVSEWLHTSSCSRLCAIRPETKIRTEGSTVAKSVSRYSVRNCFPLEDSNIPSRMSPKKMFMIFAIRGKGSFGE